MASKLKSHRSALEKFSSAAMSSKRKRGMIDFDPEDDDFRSYNDDEESQDDDEEEDEHKMNIKTSLNGFRKDDANESGREHYEKVGISQLRRQQQDQKPQMMELDEKYSGQVVRRSQMGELGSEESEEEEENDEEEDVELEDPFAYVASEDEDDPFAAPVREGSQNSEDDDEGRVGTMTVKPDEAQVHDFNELTDEDEEIDSDDAFGPGEEKEEKYAKFRFLGSGMSKRIKTSAKTEEQEDESTGPSISEDDEEEDEMSENDSDDSDLHSNEDIEDSESDVDSSSVSLASSRSSVRKQDLHQEPTTDREKLKAVLRDEASAVVSALSAAITADAEKGRAVKQQFQIYDRLLDARIKVQKGLNAANDLVKCTGADSEKAGTIIRKAEVAGLKLWSMINSMRHELLSQEQQTTSSKRRKVSSASLSPLLPDFSTPLTDLWSEMTSLESKSIPHRRRTITKWSTKTRSTISKPAISKLAGTQSRSNDGEITMILDAYLAREGDSLIKSSTVLTSDNSLPSDLKENTKATRSSNQSSSSQSLPPYTDVQFYQSLLRDLISSRSALQPSSYATDSVTNNSSVMSTKLHYAGADRPKKPHTKASKGRQVRYTVHEKLMNFMAAEDRTTWSEAAAREFFGSLLGGSGMLKENDRDENEDHDMDDYGGQEVDTEGEALKLFRN